MMKGALFSKLLFLFTPEEILWTEKNYLKLYADREEHNMKVPSIKAIFWAVISLIFSLMIGQLS